MKTVIFKVITLIILQAVTCQNRITEENLVKFMQFSRLYKRSYSSLEEQTRRFNIFSENLKKFNEYHQNGSPNVKKDFQSKKYEGRLSPNLDITWDEYKAALNQARKAETRESFKNRIQKEKEKNSEEGENLRNLRELTELPASFSWIGDDATQIPRLVENQGSCGSCYAYGTIRSLEYRIGIKNKNYKNRVRLSKQHIVDCDTANYACDGGWETNVWSFLMETGVLSEAAYPNVSQKTGKPKIARNKKTAKACSNLIKGTKKKPVSLTKIKNYRLVPVNEMKLEIFTHGPVSAAMCAGNNDVYYYQSGLLMNKDSCWLDHVVSCNGWGVTPEGVEYWQCENQWGSDWGEDGYFRVPIDNNVYLGVGEECYGPYLN